MPRRSAAAPRPRRHLRARLGHSELRSALKPSGRLGIALADGGVVQFVGSGGDPQSYWSRFVRATLG